MVQRPWQRWDDPGVVEAIDDYWARSVSESTHRQRVAELSRSFLPVSGGSLLEVGCGSGRIREHLIATGLSSASYVGVDLAVRMLALARRRSPEARLARADGFALPFRDGQFDLVVAFEVVGHLPEFAPLVREMLRVSRGRVLWTVWTASGDEVLCGHERVLDAEFLFRKYPHTAVLAEIERAVPGMARSAEPIDLAPNCRAYLLRVPPNR